MTGNSKDKDGRAVPSRRLSRLAGLGGMAAGIAGRVAAKGVRQLAIGQRPSVEGLFMTTQNAMKVTQQLSKMRGAAMKIGQMISMDSGDFLPREFADILARLRADAQHMPRAQLIGVLTSEWGEGCEDKFSRFDHQPMAAASIGQVQYAELPSGEALAIKVQYPGVRESIDSDVKNVAALLKISGLIPSHLDVKSVIEAGRVQLHQEADYEREAAYLTKFGALLAGDDNFVVPNFFPELSTDKILAMSYMESVPIESLIDAPQDTRDRVVTLLMDLTLRELFEFQAMQTDPNFANYRYDTESEQLVLLDFGASRDIEDELSEAYKNIMRAVLTGEGETIFTAAMDMGFISANTPLNFVPTMIEMIEIATEPLTRDEPFDFSRSDIAEEMRIRGMELASNRDLWHVPPADTVFIQRKIAGIYMLASRLRAQIDVRALMKKHVGEAAG